jgi:cytochrome b involved in lipid metabolism
MKDLFLGIGGLPLHPLAVHFAVALFPVALLALIAVICVKKLRAKYLTASVVAVILTLPLVFIAQQSGESLSGVLYEPQPHSEYGEMLMPLASVTAAAAAALWLSLRQNWKKVISQLLGVATVSLAVASIAMTFVVGHSGAEAVWGGKVPTNQEQVDSLPSGESLDQNGAGGGGTSGMSVSEVASHNTANDCWVVIDGSVYQLDKYMSQHPGGKAVLTSLCGKDGSKAFANQHARQALPNSELAKLYIGAFATASGSTQSSSGDAAGGQVPSATFTSNQVAAHSTGSDCWTVIEKTVYDLSGYGQEHPGGAANIAALCGKDATSAFAGQHGFAGTPANVLAAMAIGTLEGQSSLPSTKVVYGEEGDDD